MKNPSGPGSATSTSVSRCEPEVRCFGDGDPLYERYHDEEWGRPVSEEPAVFERMSLEAFQSGLSWITVLRKRDNFRRAFRDFSPEMVAMMDGGDVERLLQDPGIIRNRAKIEATIANARALSELHETGWSLGAAFWSRVRVDDEALQSYAGLAPFSVEAKELSKELKKLRFRFVGPTTAYAAMQAIGVVNDHLAACPVRAEVEAERRRFIDTMAG